MLSEERFCLLPSIFGRLRVVARPLITEKAMGRFGIDLHLKILFLVGQFGLDLVYVIRRNHRILATEEKMDRTTDLARPQERAGVTHGNGPAVKHNRRLHVLAVMRRRKISKTTSHAETSHANGTRLHLSSALHRCASLPSPVL